MTVTSAQITSDMNDKFMPMVPRLAKDILVSVTNRNAIVAHVVYISRLNALYASTRRVLNDIRCVGDEQSSWWTLPLPNASIMRNAYIGTISNSGHKLAPSAFVNVDEFGAALLLLELEDIMVTRDRPTLVAVVLNAAVTVVLSACRVRGTLRQVACASERNLPIPSRVSDLVLEVQSMMALTAGRAVAVPLVHRRQCLVKFRGITVTKLIQPDVIVRRNDTELLLTAITLLLKVRQECNDRVIRLVLLLWLTIVTWVDLGLHAAVSVVAELCTTR